MLRKTIGIALISSLFMTSQVIFAQQDSDIKTQQPDNMDVMKNELSKNDFERNLDSIRENNPEILENQPMSEDDKQIERLMIEQLDERYFSKDSLSSEEKNQLFSHYINFIMQGFNNAADAVWNFARNNDDFNINLDYYNEKGMSPLLAAAISDKEGGNVEYAIKLLKNGADPDQVTPKNRINALSLAATVDNYKTLVALLMAGANPLHETDMGFTAYDHAKKHESQKSFLILLNYHAMLSGVNDLKEISQSSQNNENGGNSQQDSNSE